jgi:hypothetical protein
MPAPALHPNSRPLRVTLLAAAMVLMGLADLQLTLTYMRSVGMIELNPIARQMIEIGGSRQLVVFKLFTIAASAGLLYLLRSHRLAERCAWISCLLLLGLTAHWMRYNQQATTPEYAALALTQLTSGPASGLDFDHRWVMLRD